MSNDNQPIEHPAVRHYESERLADIARRLGGCIDELDALGRYCEANYVAWGRDLILRASAETSDGASVIRLE